MCLVVNELEQDSRRKVHHGGRARSIAFPDVRAAIAKLHQRGTIKAATDIALSEYLLEQGGVAVVPGSASAAKAMCACRLPPSMDNLTKALERIAKSAFVRLRQGLLVPEG